MFECSGQWGWRLHYSTETDISGQNASFAPFVSMPFLSLSPSPACPSICIPLGWREEGAGALVSHPAVPRRRWGGGLRWGGGAPSLVCDLVFHMIEICLILLRINVLHWHRGDSRREGKGEDEREEEGSSLKATFIFCPTFFLRIYPCASMFVPV